MDEAIEMGKEQDATKLTVFYYLITKYYHMIHSLTKYIHEANVIVSACTIVRLQIVMMVVTVEERKKPFMSGDESKRVAFGVK